MPISADIFFGMADMPNIFFFDLTDIYIYFFLVNTRCWGSAYVADKIQSTPAPTGNDTGKDRRHRRRPQTAKSSATWPPIQTTPTYICAFITVYMKLEDFFSRLNLMMVCKISRSTSVWTDQRVSPQQKMVCRYGSI